MLWFMIGNVPLAILIAANITLVKTIRRMHKVRSSPFPPIPSTPVPLVSSKPHPETEKPKVVLG